MLYRSGKSTLMRSVLCAALLGNSGLFVPCLTSHDNNTIVSPSILITIPYYTNYYLRTSSYDIPSANQSAFAVEMDDMSILLRECLSSTPAVVVEEGRGGVHPHRSLVMIDELGKGTSSKDGASLAGAILEELSIPSNRIMGIFSTHLHELFSLPLRLANSIVNKTMMVNVTDDKIAFNDKAWTYKVVDGVCTDSLALQTAELYKIPNNILHRAKMLTECYDKLMFAQSTNSYTADAVDDKIEEVCPSTLDLDALISPIMDILHQHMFPDMSVAELQHLLNVMILERSELAPACIQACYCVYVLELQSFSNVSDFYE